MNNTPELGLCYTAAFGDFMWMVQQTEAPHMWVARGLLEKHRNITDLKGLVEAYKAAYRNYTLEAARYNLLFVLFTQVEGDERAAGAIRSVARGLDHCPGQAEKAGTLEHLQVLQRMGAVNPQDPTPHLNQWGTMRARLCSIELEAQGCVMRVLFAALREWGIEPAPDLPEDPIFHLNAEYDQMYQTLLRNSLAQQMEQAINLETRQRH